MKTINLAKQYGFNEEYEIFDYLIDSHYNGNFDQFKTIFKKLSKEGKLEFMEYIKRLLQKDQQEIQDRCIKYLIGL